ncbi:MAG: VanZ family protein [Puniceicoccales bacterium]
MMAITLASGGNPMTPPGLNFFRADKVIHLLVFGLLATAIYRNTSPNWGRGRAVFAIALTAIFGAFDELHQSYTPGRFMEIDDWIADFAGAVIAVMVYRYWHGYRRFLEWPALGKRRPERKAVT